MRAGTLSAFFNELSKLSAAFSQEQYKKVFGPKILRKGKQYASPKDNVPASQYSSLTPNDATYSPISSQSRTLEGRETPGGPL